MQERLRIRQAPEIWEQRALFDVPEGVKPERYKRWVDPMHEKVVQYLQKGKVYATAKPPAWWLDDREEGFDQDVMVNKRVADLVKWGFLEEIGTPMVDGANARLKMLPPAEEWIANHPSK